jgi:uncharacterized protein
MKRTMRALLWLMLAVLAVAPISAAEAQAYRALSWTDLLPPGEAEALVRQKAFMLQRAAPHGSLDDGGQSMASIQPGTYNTVKALDGMRVSLKGFIVPINFRSGKSDLFLLVPYYGACIHAPPPPPNQTILVRSDKPVALPALSAAVDLRGVLTRSTNQSELGASAYLLKLDRINRVS